MTFDPARYHAHLTTRWLGRPLEHAPEIDSTSSHLKRLARSGAEPLEPGRTVLADAQTAGYGQQGRSWVSGETRGLYVSTWLPARVIATPFTLVAGVALAGALRELTGSPAIGLKWVNDLVAHGRKLGGLLAEVVGSPTLPERPHGLILGIGLNLMPPGLEEAIALSELGPVPSREELLATLWNHLEREIERQETEGTAPLLEGWRSYAVTLGTSVRVQRHAEVVEGLAEDISETGALLVRQADGSVRAIESGTVRRADGRYC